jgi:hypothetical protein
MPIAGGRTGSGRKTRNPTLGAQLTASLGTFRRLLGWKTADSIPGSGKVMSVTDQGPLPQNGSLLLPHRRMVVPVDYVTDLADTRSSPAVRLAVRYSIPTVGRNRCSPHTERGGCLRCGGLACFLCDEKPLLQTRKRQIDRQQFFVRRGAPSMYL